MTVEELYQRLKSLVESGNGKMPVVVSNFYSKSSIEETEDLMVYTNYDGTEFIISVEI